ncbi:DYNAMIN RELATED PROTEIN 4C-RELATED [Salix viminalis]|uniref:DYNAMIN RELATED PROTEIN 4C-RELATED n=1 Tax=Salix viminalis TaxID=40686 RepID=A0A9Q0QDP3_SALVM|nr:DYNAMIN RELATED PROTEIN 4C-RELATED [Salix viminalis]
MRMIAYWKIVLRRMVDFMALHLQFCAQNLVNKEMGEEIVNELFGGNGGAIEGMLVESPVVAAKREKLNGSIKVLTESKNVLAKIMDRIATSELHEFSEDDLTANFMMSEIQILEESKGIQLPNFLPRTAFLAILQKKVEEVSHIPVDFAEKVWTYIEGVIMSVLMPRSENYHQLQLSTRREVYNQMENEGAF